MKNQKLDLQLPLILRSMFQYVFGTWGYCSHSVALIDDGKYTNPKPSPSKATSNSSNLERMVLRSSNQNFYNSNTKFVRLICIKIHENPFVCMTNFFTPFPYSDFKSELIFGILAPWPC